MVLRRMVPKGKNQNKIIFGVHTANGFPEGKRRCRTQNTRFVLVSFGNIRRSTDFRVPDSGQWMSPNRLNLYGLVTSIASGRYLIWFSRGSGVRAGKIYTNAGPAGVRPDRYRCTSPRPVWGRQTPTRGSGRATAYDIVILTNMLKPDREVS